MKIIKKKKTVKLTFCESLVLTKLSQRLNFTWNLREFCAHKTIANVVFYVASKNENKNILKKQKQKIKIRIEIKITIKIKT